MRNKHDKLIDNKSSVKRSGHKETSRLWFGLLFVIILIGLGLSLYVVTRPSPVAYKPEVKMPDKQLAAVSPKVTPTDKPVKEVAGDTAINDAKEKTDVSKAIKGIYISADAAASNKMQDLIHIADSTEINAMVIDVKNDSGKISYQMNSSLAKEIGATTNTIPNMKALVKQLKEKNIYLIARIVAFKDPYLAKKRSDLAIKNKDGSLYLDSNKAGWINPYNKKVWEYLVDVASQAAATGFDEVQFDYIRFSTSKAIAKADFGKKADNKSKEEIITEFTKYAYNKLKPLGVNVSADVYGTIIASSIDAQLVGQNYMEMSKYLDYICPMIYPSHFSKGNFGVKYPDMEPFTVISKILALSASKLNKLPESTHHAIVRPWLQDFTATWIDPHLIYGGDELREEIEGVYSVGYGEWLLWNSGCKYSEDGLLKE